MVSLVSLPAGKVFQDKPAATIPVAQNDSTKIYGIITDENHRPLPGAFIYITDSSQHLLTGCENDQNGNYTIYTGSISKNISKGYLQICHTGYSHVTVQDVPLDSVIKVNFNMESRRKIICTYVIHINRPMTNIERPGSGRLFTADQINHMQ
ncbi:hypothetical protein ACTHGU_21395 [Chitinophagaceae bacterium MMS25-I14]